MKQFVIITAGGENNRNDSWTIEADTMEQNNGSIVFKKKNGEEMREMVASVPNSRVIIIYEKGSLK